MAPSTSIARSSSGELNVGQRTEFEHRWSRLQHVAHVLQALLLITAATGFLGRGPANDRRVDDTQGKMRIRYERVVHYQAPTTVLIDLSKQALRDTTIRLWVDRDYLTALQLNRVVPQPRSVIAVSNGEIYEFGVFPATDSIHLKFFLMPTELGSQRGAFALQGDKPVRFTQFSAP